MQEFPIPTHLKNIIAVDTEKSNKDGVRGEIKCTCGCDVFNVYHNLNREYNPSVSYSEQISLKIRIKCCNCSSEYTLFDAATQGYDGFVCHDGKTANDESLNMYQCEECNSNSFGINVDIEAEDYDQFVEECVEESPEEFEPENYVDAFNWIVITLKCNDCFNIHELVNMELS